MIKLFRRIRQKLLTQNKFSKPAWPVGRYLLYTIGEILLVVIGILIALQFNEWNNERTRKLNEDLIIEQLKVDLKNSQLGLGEIIELKEKGARASAIVCQAFWKINVPHDSIFQYMRIPLRNTIYSPNLGTAKSLINSGNINVIKSAEIKNEITAYIEKVDYMLSDVKRYEETYYRSAREILNEILSRTLRPGSYFTRKIEESKNSTYDSTRNDEYSDLPNYIEKVPFRSNKKALFQDRKVYSAYYNLIMEHRNGSRIYREILENTDALLNKLESVSEN